MNRSDLDLHADACVVGKDALLFQYFDRKVTVSGYDPDGEKISMVVVPAVLGCVIPETGNNVILIVNQGIYPPRLEHNVLSTIQMRLHDVVVKETPKCRYLEATDISHTISVRGDHVDDVLIIPLDLNRVVSCFPTFKPTQEEFDT
jgi:hypothetical protein